MHTEEGGDSSPVQAENLKTNMGCSSQEPVGATSHRCLQLHKPRFCLLEPPSLQPWETHRSDKCSVNIFAGQKVSGTK